MNLNNYKLKAVKNGLYTLIEGTDYTVNGNTVTIKASYLGRLGAGTQTITFEMSGGNNPKLTVTIKDADAPAAETPTGPAVMKPTRPAGTAVNAIKTNNALILDGEELVFPAVRREPCRHSSL